MLSARGGDSPPRPRAGRSRWRRLAPYLLLGPVSGPLVAGIVFSLRAHRPVMAAIYAVGLLEFVILLPLLAAQLGAQVI
jgi:hypothetical protein